MLRWYHLVINPAQIFVYGQNPVKVNCLERSMDLRYLHLRMKYPRQSMLAHLSELFDLGYPTGSD